MSFTYSNPNCTLYVRRMMEKNVSPMPFIGLYVAVASMFCIMAMSLNILSFPDNIFGLNATWLTLLAVATKLTGDLTSPMWSYNDNLSKINSTLFLTVAIGEFFTSLGSMNGTDMLTNLTALSILVFTVLVDLCIQLGTGVLDYSLFPEIIFALVLLFCMFIAIVCTALTVPAIKKRAESKHQTLVKQMETAAGGHLLRVEELRLSIIKYWVMATSGSPQYLITRLASFIFSNIISLFSALIIFQGVFRSKTTSTDAYWSTTCHNKQSDYKWSVQLIIFFQFGVAMVSFVSSTVLLTHVLICKYEDNGIKISRKDFKVEPYWTENLIEWRQSPIPMRIQRNKLRIKLLHHIKRLILTFFIKLQTLVVIFIKFSCMVTFYGWFPLVYFGNHLCKQWLSELSPLEVSNDQMREEIDPRHFVILLEGEKQLPKLLLRRIILQLNVHVKGGMRQQPRSLLNLLKQSFFYKGAIQFDSSQVPNLLSEEPPNCWTLPVMTLTTIAVALPNIANQHVDELVTSVDEGLQYASYIDVLDEKHVSKCIKNAAGIVWVGVKLHKKWLDVDLGDTIREVRSIREIIQGLADEAERIVKEFSSTGSQNLVENSLYWPANVLAANSMYRISRTILLCYGNGEYQAEELFTKLICMIANILAACLTNLPHLITTKCINNAIEERLKSISNAAFLFGEIEDILKLFEERQLLGIGPDQPLCIDEWRRWMESETQDPTVSTSATDNGASSTVESNDELVIVAMVGDRKKFNDIAVIGLSSSSALPDKFKRHCGRRAVTLIGGDWKKLKNFIDIVVVGLSPSSALLDKFKRHCGRWVVALIGGDWKN
ncbi:PREDICTED: uncharacterized protein LOC109189563 [Ipomoea nil]|uniref:uncharacterized protein LOC109189563 n=1 Tax=Ipomoea nil TaxID=35883 RepID=UPI000901D326|nr:PREDICTED: uncharacterized protein LOC109189563 [Ipomoea nil]